MMKKIMCVFAAIGFFASSGSVQANEVNGDYVCVSVLKDGERGKFHQMKITDEEILMPTGQKIIFQDEKFIIAKSGGGQSVVWMFHKKTKTLSAFNDSSVPGATLFCHKFTPL